MCHQRQSQRRFITESSVGEIRAKAVAGAANNQLATQRARAMLAERNILFAPDFVLNAGGIISGFEAASSMPGRKPVTSLHSGNASRRSTTD
jgi:glutamate dehydrogenase/leucine dehydrogenase